MNRRRRIQPKATVELETVALRLPSHLMRAVDRYAKYLGGRDDTALLEVMAVVDLFSGFNKLMDGLQVEPDEKPWYG